MSDDVIGTVDTSSPSISSPAPAPAIEGAPVAQPTITTAPTSQPPATGGAPDGYVPSYRLREAREQAQRQFQSEFAAKEASIRAESDRYRQQVLALTGVQAPPNPEIQQVKGQFSSLYPGVSKLEDRAEEILAILERQGDLESQNQHYWKTYGQQTMDRVFSKTSEALGGPLTDEGKRQLHASFVGFVQSSPELTNRYANDPTIADDFVKAFTSSFIDPVRRTAATAVQGRAAFGASLPQDTPSGAPRVAPGPQPRNLDERADAAWTLYQQTHKP